MSAEEKRRRLRAGSIMLGIGLVASFDGIVFHQLLQWHSVYMDTHRQGQIISDGVFHTFAVVMLAAGAVFLWRAGRPKDIDSGRRLLVSGILLGGGGFNVIEGVINHHILQIHHVKPGDPNELLYDLLFLASGVLLYSIGMYLSRSTGSRERAVGS